MNDRWTQFLEDAGVNRGADGYTHVGTEEVDAFQKLSGDILCDLGHTARVRVTGDDAESFLQNQLTNDLRSLDTEQSMLAGYCNPKGRLICVFRVERTDTGFILELPMDVRDRAIQNLRKYVLRAKVEFADVTGGAAFGVCGKTAAKRLEQLTGGLPRRDGEIGHFDGLSLLRLPGDGRPRYRVAGVDRAAISAWGKLQEHATVIGSWVWARMDILAGIPNITAPVSESFVPQMVNLDLLGGVNFQKGCYPGQEVVARMHYLGNVKQRMARFRVDVENRPQPGERVYTQGSASPTGTVIDAQRGAGAGWDLLAVVRLADLGQGNLYLRSEQGAVLFQQHLPYDVG